MTTAVPDFASSISADTWDLASAILAIVLAELRWLFRVAVCPGVGHVTNDDTDTESSVWASKARAIDPGPLSPPGDATLAPLQPSVRLKFPSLTPSRALGVKSVAGNSRPLNNAPAMVL